MLKPSFCAVLALVLLAPAALAGASAKSRAERRAAQEIYWSLGAEPVSLDPTKQADGSSSSLLGHMFEGLLGYDAKGELVPATAESFSASPDKKVWTFVIRKDAKWHDGKPVTAKDFEYTFKRLVDPSYASVYSFIAITAGFLNAEAIITKKMPKEQLGVKAVDDRTLRVELDRPGMFFDSLMAFQIFYPVRQDLVEKFGERFAVDQASIVGNGPFKLAKWEKESSIRLEKTSTYWNAAAIKITAVESPSLVKEAQADYNNFITGGIDYISTKTGEIIRQAQDAKLKIQPYETGCVSLMALNVGKGRPFESKDLRLAVQKGIDRNEFVNKIVAMPGNKPIFTFIPDYMPGSTTKTRFRKEVPVKWKDADVAAAKKHVEDYLKSSGAKKPPVISILTTDSSGSRKHGEYWQNALAKVLGAEVRIENLPLKAMVQRERDHDYDLAMTGWCPDYIDVMTFADYHTATNDNNFTGWANAKHDELIAKANLESDGVKRMKLIAEAEAIFLADAPSIPFYQTGGAYIMAPGLSGVTKNLVGVGTDFRYASWAEGPKPSH